MNLYRSNLYRYGNQYNLMEWVIDLNIHMQQAQIKKDDVLGYVGTVSFRVEKHTQDYEITLHSKNLKTWGYSLNFLSVSGKEEELIAVDERIDEDDELFAQFVAAVTAQIST